MNVSNLIGFGLENIFSFLNTNLNFMNDAISNYHSCNTFDNNNI